MTLKTYAGLDESIRRWLWRKEDLDVANRIPDYISLLEEQMNSRLRVRHMRKRVVVPIVDGVGTLPDDFLSYQRISDVKSPRTEFLPGYPENGSGFEIDDGEIRITFPAAVDAIDLVYYGEIPPLDPADPNSTNWLLQKYRSVYLFGVLTEAFPQEREDPRLMIFGPKFEAAVSRLERQDELAQRAKMGRRRNSGHTP
jgi:hypothetical protein